MFANLLGSKLFIFEYVPAKPCGGHSGEPIALCFLAMFSGSHPKPDHTLVALEKRNMWLAGLS